MSHLFISQLEKREAMMDEKTHYGLVDESWLEIQIVIMCWYPLLWEKTAIASGPNGRLADKLLVDFIYF